MQTNEELLDPEVRRQVQPYATPEVPYGPDANEVKRQASVALQQKHQTGVPGIAGPNMAALQPAATLPGVTVPQPAATGAPAVSAAPSIGSPSATTAIGPPGVNPQLQHDQARQIELNKGSGLDQFSQEHHIAGPMLRALDIAGSVFAPNLARFIPGTTLHHDMLVNQNEGALQRDTKQAKEQADTAHVNQETEALKNPKPQKAENPEADAYAVLSDPNSTPEQRKNATDALNTVKGAGKEEKGVTSEFQLWRKDNPNGTAEDYAKFQAGHKTEATHTAEDIRSDIAKAYEEGNPAEVARLQKKLKAVGDPFAQQKVDITVQNQKDKEANYSRQDVRNHDKAYVQPAENVEKSYQMMDEAYKEYKAAKAQGKELPTGAQSMLALSSHLATTFGNVKGARVTKDMIEHHLGARGIGDDAVVAIQRFTNGDVLSPAQWDAFHDLISKSRKLSWDAATKEANRKHIPVDFLPPDLGGSSQTQEGDGAVHEEYVRDPKTNKLVLKTR